MTSPFPITDPGFTLPEEASTSAPMPIVITRLVGIKYKAPVYELATETDNGPAIISIRWIIDDVRWVSEDVVVFIDRTAKCRYQLRNVGALDKQRRRIVDVFA